MLIGRRGTGINFIGLIGIVALLFVTQATGAMTPAGTKIENRAEARYEWESETRTTWSNWVMVSVAHVPALSLSPLSGGHPGEETFAPALQKNVTPAQTVNIPYRITNTGNGNDRFFLSSETLGGDLPASVKPVVYMDRNGNGVIDSIDKPVDNTSLAAGESAALIVSLRIPATMAVGETVYVSLAAESASDPQVRETNTWIRLDVETDFPIMSVRRSTEVIRGPYWSVHSENQHVGTAGAGVFDVFSGDRIVHTITMENVGYVDARDVVLLEPVHAVETLRSDTYGLDHPLWVNGAPVSLDGSHHFAAEIVMDEKGRPYVKMTVREIASTQRIVLQYETAVDWTADINEVVKRAWVTYEERLGVMKEVVSNDVVIRRGLDYDVRIVPIGVSLDPGEPNIQIVDFAIAGDTIHFEVTVYNTGRRDGVIEIEAATPMPDGWSLKFYESDGLTPLIDTNNRGSVDIGLLAAGAARDVVIKVDLPEDLSPDPSDPSVFKHTFDIVAYFADVPDRSDMTMLQVNAVEKLEEIWNPLVLTVSPDGPISPGDELTYTLRFRNASGRDHENVRIVQYLSPHLRPPRPGSDVIVLGGDADASDVPPTDSSDGFVVLSDGSGVYDPDRHSIMWTIPHVKAGESGWVIFRSDVAADLPDGVIIEVQGELSTSVTALTVLSNVVTNVALVEGILVRLSANHDFLVPGDVNLYTLSVHNPNPIHSLTDVKVVIDVPAGLSYRKGSFRLNGGVADDPGWVSGQWVFTIDNMEPGEKVHLAFGGLVNALAENSLNVHAQAMTKTASGKPIGSRIVSVRTSVMPGLAGEQGMIVGRVLLGTSSKDTATSIPVGDVRVIMENGRYAITDADGRFSITSVRPGPHFLRIDPATLKQSEVASDFIDPDVPLIQRVIVPASGMVATEFYLVMEVVSLTSREYVIEEDAS